MEEAARISRGKLHNLVDYDLKQLDLLVIPGGAGCITSLSDFGEKFEKMTVHPEVDKLIKHMHEQDKPIGAVCIAPVLLAKALGVYNPALTVGNNDEVEKCLGTLGAKIHKCVKGEAVQDSANKLVSTPAYMYGDSTLSQVQQGIEKMIELLASFLR